MAKKTSKRVPVGMWGQPCAVSAGPQAVARWPSGFNSQPQVESWVMWEAVLGIRPKMDHFRWR